MPTSTPSWHRYSTAFPSGRSRPIDHVELGPNLVDGLDRRLLGDVTDKRVLELGTGMGHSAIAMALQGAKVIGVDPDSAQLEYARELADEQEIKVELHNADLADLAFVRNESVDLVISIHALAAVEDLDRVFRQAHRVLKADMPFVLSLPHPTASLVDPFSEDELRIARGYFEPATLGSGPSLTHRHLIGEVFSGLIRANFRVDTLIENPYADKATLPETLVFRAKKVGN
ncbi:MAG: class I SAM-dependent methyltransferase [Acidimicrobiales bacterium]